MKTAVCRELKLTTGKHAEANANVVLNRKKHFDTTTNKFCCLYTLEYGPVAVTARSTVPQSPCNLLNSKAVGSGKICTR